MGITRRVAKHPFSIGGANGDTLVPLPPLDLSHASTLELVATLTQIGTDAADTLDIELQELLEDGVTWDTRIHLGQILGNASASATAPLSRKGTSRADTLIDQANRAFTPTGSSDGADLVTATVRDGPFPAKLRTAAGWVSGWRFRLTIGGDVNTNSVFVGELWLRATEK